MSELSREQVDKLFLLVKADTTHQTYDRIVAIEQEHAALRAQVAALTQRIEAEEPIFHDMVQQLAALELANTTLHEEVTKLEKMLYPGGT